MAVMGIGVVVIAALALAIVWGVAFIALAERRARVA